MSDIDGDLVLVEVGFDVLVLEEGFSMFKG